MDLAIEANRNSALFATMQEVLDVYNPLLHKARPTVVNQTKHRIRVQPSRWSNTMDSWNGARTARYDLPRIGSLYDASVKVSFVIPGEELQVTEKQKYGDIGVAKTTLKRGTITDNTNATTNNARERLNRIYADDLLGLNMIKSYKVMSKSRQIFQASGEYLLQRFSQLDEDHKKSILKSTTPKSVFDGIDDMYYAPQVTYSVSTPLWMFFNEHITNAMDVNFSEEVHIEIDFRAPSELFYYGNLGNLARVSALMATGEVGQYQQRASSSTYDTGLVAWDQSTTLGSEHWHENTNTRVATTIQQSSSLAAITATGATRFGSANVALSTADDDVFNDRIVVDSWTDQMNTAQQRHIQGIGAPFAAPANAKAGAFGLVGTAVTSGSCGYVHGGTTFSYPDVDTNGESILIQTELSADYIIQDTDAARALRAQMYPEGSGLTTITFDTAQETFSNIFADKSQAFGPLLDVSSGGTFSDPGTSARSITVGDSTKFVDLQLKVNNLCLSTSFMVRKMSDLGAGQNSNASTDAPTYGTAIQTKSNIGAHRIYTRCVPVHYFQLISAGRVIWESNAAEHMQITQPKMYLGTGEEFAKRAAVTTTGFQTIRNANLNSKPMDIYTINFGIDPSRLENSGSMSYQNLNNPTLRIYFKPDTWAEHVTEPNPTSGESEAGFASTFGVQVDVIHEFFNVVTVNSGNGEITSGLNQ